MAKYLSIDTEATGLEENCLMIQLAFVPVDTDKRVIDMSLGKEILIQCPSFEDLKPNLNKWVVEHNESLIRDAHSKGVNQEKLIQIVTEYLESEPVKKFFNYERMPLMGKSMSALDIPLMTRYFGRAFYEKYFHHHTLDITCVARGLVDAGVLPPGNSGTTKLMRYFKIREDATHTALNDAVDMGKIYFGLLDLLAKKESAKL
jgi:DNA polymerase III epsilon subunit-like protein